MCADESLALLDKVLEIYQNWFGNLELYDLTTIFRMFYEKTFLLNGSGKKRKYMHMPKYKCINETIRCRHVSKNKKLAIQIELVVNIEKKKQVLLIILCCLSQIG